MSSRLPAAERRSQLLGVAAKIFAERGYSRATTAELARAAGVTEPIIYRHFSSKKDMFIALIEQTGEDTIRTWQEQLAETEDPAQRLRILFGANPMVTNRGRGVYRIIVQAMTEIDDEQILEALQHHMQALQAFLSNEVRRAQDAGHVSKRFSPDVTAWILIHLGLGYGVLAPVGVPGHARDSSGVHVRDVVERMMLGDRQA